MDITTHPPAAAAEPMSPAQVFFSLRGRIPRRTFWLYGVLALLGLGLYAKALLDIARVQPDATDALINLLLLWPAVAVSSKRWHDRDKSGWWVLIVLLPVIGGLWALVDNGLLRGTHGPNRFGADPLANADQ